MRLILLAALPMAAIAMTASGLMGGNRAQAQASNAAPPAFAQCKACHTLNKGGKNLVGPNLHGLSGRKAASVPGFNYSPALKKSGIVWTDAQLDAYLANPTAKVPGTRMFVRVNNPQQRAALIAYLKAETAK